MRHQELTDFMAETSFSQALGRLSASHPESLVGPNYDSWKADKGVHEESERG